MHHEYSLNFNEIGSLFLFAPNLYVCTVQYVFVVLCCICAWVHFFVHYCVMNLFCHGKYILLLIGLWHRTGQTVCKDNRQQKRLLTSSFSDFHVFDKTWFNNFLWTSLGSSLHLRWAEEMTGTVRQMLSRPHPWRNKWRMTVIYDEV